MNLLLEHHTRYVSLWVNTRQRDFNAPSIPPCESLIRRSHDEHDDDAA